MRSLHLDDARDTHALGLRLGRAAHPGARIALAGDLGAGKTSLVRGLAEGLGVPGRVQSPTYVIVQVHEGGRLPLWHADLYRLGGEDELALLGLDQPGDAVVVVEWAERFPGVLGDDRLEVHLADEGEGRRAVLRATGLSHAALEAAGGG